MAENYKISLGIGLDDKQLHTVKTTINNLVDKERKINLDIDFNIKNADRLASVGREIETIKKSLEGLNNVGSIGKGKGKSILSVDSESLKKTINTIHEDMKRLQNAFGRVDKNKGTQSLLTTVNKIRAALEGVTKQFEGLNQSLMSLSGKDFNINLDLGLGGSNKKDPTQLMKELRVLEKEAREYENYIYKTLNKTNKVDEVQSRNSIYDLANRVGKSSSKAYIRGLDEIISGTGANSNKIAAYKEYINVIKELASVGNITLAPVESKMAESGDFVKIKNEANEAKEAVKELFSGGINGEILSKQLDDIVVSLSEIQKTLQSLSTGVTVEGLTQSFDKLSDTIDKLVSNVTLAKNALGDIGDTTVSDGGVEKAVQDQKELAQSSTQTANVVAQSGQKIQQSYQKISNSASSIGEADVLQLKDDITDADKLSASLSKLKNIQGNINKIKIGEIDASKGVQEIQTLERQLESLSAEHRETVAEINKLGGVSKTQYQSVQNQVNTTNLKLEQLQSKIVDVNTKLANGIRIKIHDQGFDGFEQEIARAKIEADKFKSSSIGLQEALKQLDIAMEAINAADEANDINQLINANKQYEAALKQVYSQIKLNQQAEKNANDKASFKTEQQNALLRLKGLFNENSEAARKFASDVDRLQKELNECGDVSGVRRVNKEITNLSLKIKEAGVQTETFGQKLKAQWEQYKTYLSVASLISYGTQALRNMFEQVKLIDSAMTELKKVTNETDETYNKFLTNAADRAKEIGTTIDGLVSSTADFARLGYGFEDAQGLAEVANIYAVVGDEIEGVEGATESLISTMAAFKDEFRGTSNTDAAMRIVDIYNELGNKFAITSGGLGEALERSASSLAAANNSIYESAALITAANTVVQDPEQVGTAFKTISMRIRGAKTELEEMGEDTTGMVESTAKLREEILALSGVDIMKNGNEFKSTYAIMDELAAKWKDLTDIQQASITELIAGKRQGNIVSSLMTNFDTAREALETSMNSAGSAMKEHEKWQQSLEAQILKLKASWQGLSQAFLKSDFLRVALNGVIALVDGLTKLIDTFGALPTLVTAFAAFKSFNGKGFFKVIEDEASVTGKKITSVFSNTASAIKQTFSTSFSFETGFEKSLNDDVIALNNYIAKLQSGVPAEEAFAQTMREASAEAQHFAQTVNTATISTSQFETIARQSQITEQAKSFKNAKSLISEYNGGLKNCKLTQTEFIDAVGKSNTNFAKYLSSVKMGDASLGKYIISLVGAKVASFALEAATLALNAAITMGISLIISGIVSAITSWINREKELAEQVEEVTSKFKEQHQELQKIKGDFNTDNESSMISRYEKLSKGVGNFNENISLTADEYSEYQSIVNKIADQFPTLIQGYDDQGNAILKLGTNIDTIIDKYERLIHAQNQQVLSENSKNIEDKFGNALNKASGYGFWEGIGNYMTWDGALGGEMDTYDMKLDTVEWLESLTSKSSLDEIKKYLKKNDFKALEIIQSLQKAGYDVNRYSSNNKIAETIANALKNDPGKIQGIIDNYYTQFDDVVAEYKTKATAVLSEAFDISSSLSGMDYNDMNKNIQSIAYSIVNGLDFNALSEIYNNEGIESWTKNLLKNLQKIDDTASGAIETSLNLKTEFNNGDISYSKYIDGLKNATDIINDLDIDSEIKSDLLLSLNADDAIAEYEALMERFTSKEETNGVLGFGFDEETAKKFLDSLSSEELAVLIDIIPNLDASATINEIKTIIDEKLAEEFTFDIKVQTEGIEAFNTALEESRSAAGLTAESIQFLTSRYEELKGFNAAALFERTANGVRLNNEELARLEVQYENVNKLDIAKNLNTLIEKYNKLTDKIADCTDETKKEQLQLEANSYAEKIKEMQILSAQYDGLTSAFNKWQTAQSSANSGDNYDSIYENIETVQELYKKGLVGTDDFKTFAQLISDEDLSTASTDEIVNAYKKGIPVVKKYFTEGQEGCKTFLNDISKLNSEWAHLNENGEWEINIDVEEAAKELETSVDFIYLILDKLKDYGFEINIDNTSVDDLQTDIEKAEAKVKELGKTPISVDLDVKTENVESEIEKVKAHIAEINNSSVNVETKTAQLEDAKLKLEALIQKKQEASQPAFMSLDTSQVNASLVDALAYVQEYQTAIDDLSMLLELKEAGITIDDSALDAAQKKVNDTAKSIQGLDGEVKVAIGLEEDGSIESIKKAFEEGKVKIDADTDPALTKIELLAENIERIEDKDVTINVTVNGLDQVEKLNEQIDLATNVQGDIDALSKYVESAKELNKLGNNITSYVTAEVKGNVIDTKEYKLDNLKVFGESAKEVKELGTFTSKATANVEGNVIETKESKLDNLKVFTDSAKDISKIGVVTSTVTADIKGNVIDTKEYKLNNLKVFTDSAKDVNKIGVVTSKVTANIDGNVIDTKESKIDNLKIFTDSAKDVKNISNVESKVCANIEGNVIDIQEGKIDNLKVFTDSAKDIGKIGNVKSSVTAEINGNVVETREGKLDNLKVFTDNAKDIKNIGVITSKVVADIDGNVIETKESKLDNLNVFANGANKLKNTGSFKAEVTANINGNVKDIKEIEIDNLGVFADNTRDLKDIGSFKSEVTANVYGNIIDTKERKIDNLKEFYDSAKDLKNVGTFDSSVEANVEGNVVNTKEYKLDNLKVYSDSAKNLKDIGAVSSNVDANVKGNVVDTKESKINNLKVFYDSAKDIEKIGIVESDVLANVGGNVIDTKESKINNLKVFYDSAKDIGKIGNIESNVNANVKGNVIDTKESKINNLKVFYDSAKDIKDVGSSTSNVTANIYGNVIDTKEKKIDNLSVFANSADKLKNIGNFTSGVSANVSGNVITDSGVNSNLEHFASIVSGMSDKTVTVNVSANVDSANVNQAITLLTNVANSGVFKDYKATVQVGATITTIDDATVQNYQAPKKDGKVAYSVDPDSSVFTWTAPNKNGVVNYSASVEALTDAQKHKTGTITYQAKVEGAGGLNGTANSSGSSFVNGTNGKAFRQGDWRTKKTETALVGELGREIIVTPENRWYTVGDAGAQFAKIPRGSIVFNHKQTEELLKNGKVTSNGGRGKALVNGTAFATGSGSGGFYGEDESSNPSSDIADEFEEVLDWIEVIIDRVERSIDKFDRQANNIYKSWSSRNDALLGQISEVENEIVLQEKAYSRYIQAANNVGLDSSWISKIQNGQISIETITDEDLSKKIKDYQDFYEAALDAKDAIEELREEESKLYSQRFENIQTQYDAILQGYEHTENMLNEYIAQSEAQGYITSKKYYQALIENEKDSIAELKDEQLKLIAARDTAVASGAITEGSEDWHNMCTEIDSVTQAIEESTTALLEYDNAIRDIDWSVFDLIQERISGITEEADFLIELMSNEKLFDDDGKLTSQGLATMALHSQNYNTHMYAADTYGEEVAKLDKQIANDPYDQELINRRNELLKLQRESILAAEDEKNAIKDLVSEGIEYQLDSLQELIDKKNEQLESEKALYDYQKKVAEQSKNIASIQKQLSAYSGDNSEEAKAKVQKLQLELKDAEDELAETEMDKLLDDTSALLDSLFLEAETILNQRLDNIDYLLEQVVESINIAAGADSNIASALSSEGAIAIAVSDNASSIKDTLASEAKNVGTSLSAAMNNIWSTGDGNAKSVLTTYGEDFKTKSATVITTLNGIKTSVNSMLSSLNKEATTKTTANKTSTSAKKNPTASSTTTKKTTTTTKKTGGDGKPKIGDRVKFVSGQYYYDSQGKKPLGSQNQGKYVYITNINTRDWATHGYHISTGNKLGKGDLGWLKLNQISGYAVGAKKIISDEMAWTQEKGREYIVRPSDGAILTPVAKGDSVLNAQASGNIWDMANSPAEFIKDNLKLNAANVPNNSSTQSVYHQTIENVTFDFKNVKNYEEMLHALKDDKRFEKLVTAMTIDRIAGKSSLAKGKSIR